MNDSHLNRRTTQWLGMLCLICAGSGANRVLADTPAESQDQQVQKSPTRQATEAERIDPRAVAELKKTTTLLDSKARLALKVRATWEAIQGSGMKLQFEADQEIGIKRPNQIYSISKRNDGAARKLWYERGTLTYLDVEANEYSQLSVPETINEMLDDVLEHYDIPAPPMLDFLYSDAETSFLSEITDALYVGVCLQGGKMCHHLAFSKVDVDYQVWIPTEGRPLPVKYSITWTDEPLLPWFTVDFLEWNTEPTFPEGTFTAAVPPGAKRSEVSLRSD